MRGPGTEKPSWSILPHCPAQRAPVVMNLKLHHKQMHYRQSSFLNDFTMKTTTKGIKNMLPEHEKLKIYWTKSNLGGVSLVG